MAASRSPEQAVDRCTPRATDLNTGTTCDHWARTGPPGSSAVFALPDGTIEEAVISSDEAAAARSKASSRSHCNRALTMPVRIRRRSSVWPSRRPASRVAAARSSGSLCSYRGGRYPASGGGATAPLRGRLGGPPGEQARCEGALRARTSFSACVLSPSRRAQVLEQRGPDLVGERQPERTACLPLRDAQPPRPPLHGVERERHDLARAQAIDGHEEEHRVVAEPHDGDRSRPPGR